MDLTLSRESGVPLYRQIVEQIREQVTSGSLGPGDRLPTVRQLAADHRVTRLTVHSAYAELQVEGLIESQVGRGTFVAESGTTYRSAHAPRRWTGRSSLAQLLRANDDRAAVSFAEAMPEPESYPLREIGEAAQRALRNQEALDYGPIQGDSELRNQMSRLLLDRGVSTPPEALLVTAGAQQGIDLALRSLVGQRDVILVEEPTYPGVLEAATQQGRRVVGVPRDESGLDMDALDAACRAHRPALLYVVPTFGNPTGASLPPEQCRTLLELARTHDFLILEDDVYGFLALDGPAGAALKSRDTDGRVLYLTSLSKALAPSLRLGIVAAPEAQLPAIGDAKQGADLVCSTLLQRTVAEYLRAAGMRMHLERVRALYRGRRDAMLDALERYLPSCDFTRPAGGLSLWITLPEMVDERDFVRDALDEGVRVAPGRAFASRPLQRASMRLSYGMQTSERIDEGLSVLGRVLRHHVDRRGSLFIAGNTVGPLV